MADDAGAGHVHLNVKDQQGSEVQFKIRKSTPLRKLMNAYCSRLGLQASEVRFMVDGERIAPGDTAEKLGLEDEGLIHVAMEQTGSVVVVIFNRQDMSGMYDVDVSAGDRDGTACYRLSQTNFTITRRNEFWWIGHNHDGIKPYFCKESKSATPPSGEWQCGAGCTGLVGEGVAQVVVAMPSKQGWDTTLLLQDMWEKRKFTDAVIICGGEHISVHRALLSSASPVFDAAFSSTMSEAREAKYEIKESSLGAVKGMLQYIYTGALQVESQELAGLLELAVQYQINTLIGATATELSDGIAAENVKDRLNVLKRHADHDLVSPALKKVCRIIKESASDDLLLAAS